MKAKMRQKLARQPFTEKIRKAAEVPWLANTFPPAQRLTPAQPHGK